MYRIFCESYQNFINSFYENSYRLEMAKPLELIVNIEKYKEEEKKQSEGQLSMYNYKLAEIAHELDKININELTPIDAMNILVKLKESAS